VELSLLPDAMSPKFQFHWIAPVDWSENEVGGVLAQTGVVVKFATGSGFTVAGITTVSVHPLAVVVISETLKVPEAE
jgi:hypothetical protein